MELGPVETYTVHVYTKSSVCALYEDDSMFGKFELVLGSDEA